MLAGSVKVPIACTQEEKSLSMPSFKKTNWLPATVPGTVLTTLLDNKKIPDPFFGMNNERIPDIYKTGSSYYTYWFIKDFNEPLPEQGKWVWLNFRGINYSADIFLNGHKLTNRPCKRYVSAAGIQYQFFIE